MESQLQSQKYAVVSADNASRDYRMQLCQLMDIPVDLSLNVSGVDYDSAMIMSEVPDYLTVYQAALRTRPEVKSGELALEMAETSIKTARSGFYPTVTLGAGIGTANGEKSDIDFGEQIKNNWSNSVGLSVNVPILTGRKNSSALERAKLKKRSSEIQLEDVKDELLWKIERIWMDAINAQENYKAACAKADAVHKSYDLVSQQFEVGLKNPTDLLAQKDELLSAQQSMIQAKYTAIYNINLLRYYAGEKLF